MDSRNRRSDRDKQGMRQRDENVDLNQQGERMGTGGGALPESVVGQAESPMTGGPRNPRTAKGTRDLPPQANPDQDMELELRDEAGGDEIARGREEDQGDLRRNSEIREETNVRNSMGEPQRRHAGGRGQMHEGETFGDEND